MSIARLISEVLESADKVDRCRRESGYDWEYHCYTHIERQKEKEEELINYILDQVKERLKADVEVKHISGEQMGWNYMSGELIDK